MNPDGTNKNGRGFSNRPFYNNTNVFKYSTELWHYGVKGMHWGEITKEYKKVGSRATSSVENKTSANNVSPVKDAVSKIANLESIKKKMRQKQVERLGSNVIRYDNKVVTINKSRKSVKDIVKNGAIAIPNMRLHNNKKADDYKDAFEKMLKNKKYNMHKGG